MCVGIACQGFETQQTPPPALGWGWRVPLSDMVLVSPHWGGHRMISVSPIAIVSWVNLVAIVTVITIVARVTIVIVGEIVTIESDFFLL